MKKRFLFSISALVILIVFSLSGCFESGDNGDSGNDENKTSDESSFTYSLNSDGKSYSIVGITNDNIVNLVIPEEYQGLPVTSIMPGVFEGMKISHVENVKLSKNISSVGTENFCNSSIITTVNFSSGLDEVPKGCFNNLTGLSEIFWGENITKIGDNTFKYCKSLANLSVPEGISIIGSEAFSYSGIVSLQIPSSVTEIGENAFYHSESLNSIVIENGITNLDNVFVMCENIEVLKIPNSVVSVKKSFCHAGNSGSLKNLKNLTAPIDLFGEYAVVDSDSDYLNCGEKLVSLTLNARGKNTKILTVFACNNLETLVISDGITEIGDYAFAYAYKLREINIPNSVEIIGNFAFSAQYALPPSVGGSSAEVLNLGCGVKTIGDGAFYEQNNLVTVSGGENVESIGNAAFAYCKNLKTLNFGKTVKTIGNSAFEECSSLTDFSIGENVESIGSSAFKSSGLTEAVIPDNVTYIGEYAFANTLYCEKLTLGKGIPKIMSYTFAQMDGLFELVIPEGIEKIDKYAFRDCKKLGSITFSSSVISVDNSAFFKCEKVREVVINGADILFEYSEFSDAYNGYGIYGIEKVFATEAEKETGTVFKKVRDFMFYTKKNGEHFLHSYYAKDERVTLPENFEGEPYAIEDYVFYDNEFIKEVIVSGNITAIGVSEGAVFAECSNLEKIVITAPITKIIKSLCFNCKSLSSVILPDTVTQIGTYAFSACYNLTYIKLPGDLEIIEDHAFYNSSIEGVVFSEKITDVGLYAFAGCDVLYVYFEGTEAEWSAVDISERNNELVGANVYYYSEKAPEKDGNYYHYDSSGEPLIWS